MKKSYDLKLFPLCYTCALNKFLPYEISRHWRIQGTMSVPRIGPNSFVLTNVYAEKRPYRRSTSHPQRVGALHPLSGNPGSTSCMTCSWVLRTNIVLSVKGSLVRRTIKTASHKYDPGARLFAQNQFYYLFPENLSRVLEYAII